MTRFRFTWAALLVLACGCGDEAKPLPSMEALLPDNNEIASWIEDTSQEPAGPQIGTTVEAVEGFIDGDADPFTARTFAAFGREYYTNGVYRLELRIWQMKDAATAKDVYDKLPTEDARYGNYTWAPLDLGAAGRIADAGTTWWLHARKGPFYLEVSNIANNSGGMTAAQGFASAILAKIP